MSDTAIPCHLEARSLSNLTHEMLNFIYREVALISYSLGSSHSTASLDNVHCTTDGVTDTALLNYHIYV